MVGAVEQASGRGWEAAVRITIAELRRNHPTWQWTTSRAGFGWHYNGRKGKARVKVYATSHLCGPAEDDFTTVWRVDDGTTSETYFVWSLDDEPPW